jgi:hypothetical protein
LLEHFFRQGLANSRDRRFQLGELGSPGQSGGTIEAINQVFCYALDVSEFFVYSRSRFLVFRHP